MDSSKSIRFGSCFLVVAVALLISQASYAATSASVNGYVKDVHGSPISGASITIEHEPSGTTAIAKSGTNGTFYQSGLRVGGPYRILVDAPGYESAEVSAGYLKPGNQAAPAIALQSDSNMDEIVVTARRPDEGTLLNNGVGSAYTSEDLQNQPSGTRDAIKTLLRDPLAHSSGEGNLSVAGVNPRFNGLAIDGSLQQDDFGLGSNTYATERSPVNLDAIESVSLVSSDYSASASGFTGGLVNITTKSGANEWDGSVFYYFQNDGHIGDTYDGNRSYSPGTFDETELGVTLGGPIVEDTMFFFVSIDQFESTESVDFASFDANNGIQSGFFDALRGVIQDVYDYDPGTRPAVASTPVTSDRTLIKFDWNVNEFHRFSVTHQITKETSTSVGASRLSSNWIDIPVDLDSTTLQLFSDWTDLISTTLRFNTKNFERGQNCRAGPGVGALEISNIRADELAGTPLAGLLTGRVSINAGCDRFRHANAYNDERVQVYAAMDYLLQDHILKFGFEVETFDLYNLFVPSSAGRFRFVGYSGLASRTARVDYVNTVTNNAEDGAAAWGYSKQTFFAQDIFEPWPDVELSLGARLERYTQDDRPASSRELQQTYGIRSETNLDGRSVFLPRASVRWTGLTNTVVSGGFGLFSGGDPKVWTSNAFQVPTVFARLSNAQDVSPLTVPSELVVRVGAATAGVPIDVISHNFEIPSDWKLSLRLDHTFDFEVGDFDLGEDFSLAVQYLRTTTNNGFQWRNLAQTELRESQPTGTAPDGRVIYADLDNLRILNLTQLRNFSGGSSQTFSVALEKEYELGLDVSVSYAWQDVNMVTEGGSSRGISNWRGIVDVDRNDPSPRNSPYAKEHSYKFNVGYQREIARGILARADLFGRIYTESKFTFTFDTNWDNSLFGRAGAGESPYDNNPLYVPKGDNDPRVVYGPGFDRSAFQQYLAENDVPSGIHKPYSGDAGWNNIWDLRFQVSVPGLSTFNQYFGENSVKFVLDIENVLNLLNDEWGVFEYGPSFGQAPIVRADLVSASDVAANGVAGATALKGDSPRTECQQPGDCVYRFNSFREYALTFPNGPRSVYQIRFGIRLDL